MSDKGPSPESKRTEGPDRADGPDITTPGDVESPKDESVDRSTAVKPAPKQNELLAEIFGGSGAISVLAVVLALIAGGILMVLTSRDVAEAAGYFFSRPGDTFAAIADTVGGAYSALFRGSVFNYLRPEDFGNAIRPFTQTLSVATPLIVAGLGVALAFRVGLFNIGGRGQMLVAAGAAGWVGAYVELPFGIHLVVALVAGIIAGALWGGIAGLLKAKTGAHEVIVTIMLNYVGFYLLSYLLRTPGALQAPGQNNPKSGPIHETAQLPTLVNNLDVGFLLVIALTIYVWYLLNRSSMGFQFRAVGANPHAARVAGINVEGVYIKVMLIAGGLVGIAGVTQVLGNFTGGFSSGLDAGIGFDAITVALLGRSKPWGVFLAGILFGALKAGSPTMQAAEGIPVDIVLVVQSFIVLFIAAPPLVRSIFRLPTPDGSFVWRLPKLGRKAEVSK